MSAVRRKRTFVHRMLWNISFAPGIVYPTKPAIAMSAENLLHAPAARTCATNERKPSLKKTSARMLSPIA